MIAERIKINGSDTRRRGSSPFASACARRDRSGNLFCLGGTAAGIAGRIRRMGQGQRRCLEPDRNLRAGRVAVI